MNIYFVSLIKIINLSVPNDTDPETPFMYHEQLDSYSTPSTSKDLYSNNLENKIPDSSVADDCKSLTDQALFSPGLSLKPLSALNNGKNKMQEDTGTVLNEINEEKIKSVEIIAQSFKKEFSIKYEGNKNITDELISLAEDLKILQNEIIIGIAKNQGNLIQEEKDKSSIPTVIKESLKHKCIEKIKNENIAINVYDHINENDTKHENNVKNEEAIPNPDINYDNAERFDTKKKSKKEDSKCDLSWFLK